MNLHRLSAYLGQGRSGPRQLTNPLSKLYLYAEVNLCRPIYRPYGFSCAHLFSCWLHLFHRSPLTRKISGQSRNRISNQKEPSLSLQRTGLVTLRLVPQRTPSRLVSQEYLSGNSRAAYVGRTDLRARRSDQKDVSRHTRTLETCGAFSTPPLCEGKS